MLHDLGSAGDSAPFQIFRDLDGDDWKPQTAMQEETMATAMRENVRFAADLPVRRCRAFIGVIVTASGCCSLET